MIRALSAMLLMAAACSAQSAPRATAAVPAVAPVRHLVHASSTPPAASHSTASSPRASTPKVPVVVGPVVAGPVSSVSHPGGIPGVNSPIQPAPGFQPLLPTGTFTTYGGTRGARNVAVIYGTPQVFGYMAAPFVAPDELGATEGDPNAPQQGTMQSGADPNFPPERSAPPESASPEPPTTRTPGPADVPYTLLAFKDHYFFAVTDYWVAGDRIAYVTNYGENGSAPLDKLDQSLTTKLNGDRGVTFELHSK